jgi:uncharacterized membrane protein
MPLIPDAAKAHKFASMWVAGAVALFGAIEMNLPAIQGALPPGVPTLVFAVLFAAARLLKQDVEK